MRTPLHPTDAAESRTMTLMTIHDDDAEFAFRRRRRRRGRRRRPCRSRPALLLLLAVAAGLSPGPTGADVAVAIDHDHDVDLDGGSSSGPDHHRGRRRVWSGGRRRELGDEGGQTSVSPGRTRLHHQEAGTDDGEVDVAAVSDAPRLADDDESSTSVSLPPYKLTTSFDGERRGYGNMFDVVAAATSVTIVGLDLHVDLINSNVPVRVYVTRGTHVGRGGSSDGWEVIFDSTIRGSGGGGPTPLPPDDFSGDVTLTLAPGETMGFYVTLTESAHMLYSSYEMTSSSNVSTYAPTEQGPAEGGASVYRDEDFAVAPVAADASRVDAAAAAAGDAGGGNFDNLTATTAGNSSRTSTVGEMSDGGIVVNSNGHLSVLSGIGVRYPFGESFAGRDWNGVLHYRLNPSLSDAMKNPAPTVRRLDTRDVIGDGGEGDAVHGIAFEVVVNVPGRVLTLHGMELRTRSSSSGSDGGWVRVEVHTLAGSYRDGGMGIGVVAGDSTGGGGGDATAATPRWTRIAEEYVRTSSTSGPPATATTPLSPFVNPVRITIPPSSGGGGGDDVIIQSFYVTMSGPDLLSVPTDDPVGTSVTTTPSGAVAVGGNSAIFDVLVGMAVNDNPPVPPSSFFDSIDGGGSGGSGSAHVGGHMFDGVILYSLSDAAAAEPAVRPPLEGVQTPEPTLTPTLPPPPTISPTAEATPFPTPSYLLSRYPSGPKTLSTGYEFPNERFSHGNAFDVVATEEHALVVTSLSFHSNLRLSNETYSVRVYSKPGSYRAGAVDAQLWERIADVEFRGGRGEGVGTQIPTGQFRNVEIAAGETRAFIVLLSHPNIIYSAYSGPQVGRPESEGGDDAVVGGGVGRDDVAYASNDDLDILVGGGIGRYEFNVWSEKHFGELFADRIWHGTVHYRSASDPGGGGDGGIGVLPPRPAPSPSPSSSSTDLRPSTGDDASGPTLPPTPPEVLTHRTGREILSTLSGGATGTGCMFDISASERSGSVVVRSLDVLTVAVRGEEGEGDEVAAVARLLDGIAVYSREGSYASHESDPDAWTERTVSSSIPGREAQEMRGEYLVKVDLDVPMVVPAGEVVGLYVTLSSSDLIYSEALTQGEGDVYTSNENVSLMVGIGMQAAAWTAGTGTGEGGSTIGGMTPFGGDYETAPAVFNGIIYYSVLTPGPTMSPTPSPTRAPTAADGSRPVVSQQLIRLVGISRRRLLELYHHSDEEEERERHHGTRGLASSPVLEDDAVVAFFEETVLDFLNDRLRRANPTLEVRDVVVSTDIERGDVQQLTEKEAFVRRESTRRHKDTDEFFGSLRRSLRGRSSRGGVARLLQSPAEPSSLDVYTTISAGFIPPPEVDFNSVVEDTFDDQGDAFVRQLKEEPAFEEVTGVEARTVSFPLPPLPPRTPAGGNEGSSGSAGAKGGLGPGIIAGLVVAAVASLILMGGLVYLFVVKKKKERLRQDLLVGSARLRNASGTDYQTGEGMASGNPEWDDDDSASRDVYDDDEKKKKKAYARGASHSSPGAYISYSGAMDCKDDGSVADDESEAKAKGRKKRAVAASHHTAAPDDVKVYHQEAVSLKTAEEVLHGAADLNPDDSDGAKKPRAQSSLSPKTKALSPRRRKSKTKTISSPARASATTPLESTEESSDSDVLARAARPPRSRSAKRPFGIKGFSGGGKKSSPKPPSPPPSPPPTPSSPEPIIRAMRRSSELSSSEPNTNTTDTGGGTSSSTTYTDATTTDGAGETSASSNESDNSKVRFHFPLVTEVRTRPRTSPEEVINLFHSPPMKKKKRRRKKKKGEKEKKDKQARRDSNESESASTSSSGDGSSVATSESLSDGKRDEEGSNLYDDAVAKDYSAVSNKTSGGGDVPEDEGGASGADLNVTPSDDGAAMDRPTVGGADTMMGKSEDYSVSPPPSVESNDSLERDSSFMGKKGTHLSGHGDDDSLTSSRS